MYFAFDLEVDADKKSKTEADTQPLAACETMEVDVGDCPLLSSFDQTFYELKRLAGGDNLKTALDIFTDDCNKNKSEKVLVSICRKYEQDVYCTMVAPSTLRASNHYQFIQKAAQKSMKDCDYGKSEASQFYETDPTKCQFLWEELLHLTILVLGDYQVDMKTLPSTADVLNHYEDRYWKMVQCMLGVFHQTTYAVRLRSRLRTYVRNVLRNKLRTCKNVYVNIPLPVYVNK